MLPLQNTTMDLPEYPAFLSTSHNESQITINSKDCDLSLSGLQQENEMLKKKITYLKKIISLKDNTIDDLNKKLLELSKEDKITPIIDDYNNLSSTSNDHINPTKTAGSKSANVTHHQKSSSVNSNQLLNDNSSKSLLEIPQRNSNRSLSKTPSLASPLNEAKAINNNSINNNNNDISNNNSNNNENKHKHNYSITSITSSKYSDNDDASDNQTPIIGVLDDSRNNNNTTSDDITELYNHQSTLELDLKQGNITLGSSPRKLSPNRRSFSLNELALKTSVSSNNTTAKTDTNNDGDNDDNNDDDFNFGVLASPEEPVYRKLNKDYSSNSSPIVDYLAQKKSNHLTSDSVGAVPLNFSNSTKSILENPLNAAAFVNNDNNDLSTSHSTINSIQDSLKFDSIPTLEDYNATILTNQKVLISSTLLQNNKQDTIQSSQTPSSIPPIPSQPSVSNTLAPTLPIHPPSVPPHPIPQSLTQTITPPTSTSSSTNNHKIIESTDDSEKFLLNSLNHAIIRIESLIDPLSLATPLDNTDSSSAENKRNNYKISFIVYTDENPNALTPIYRVKKSYLELISMDKLIRPLIPSLPSLPDFFQVACLNQRHWANSKKVIQNYINKLLSLLKNQKPFNPNNSIWTNFSDYFEFKMDYTMSTDPEFSVLNLQNKITYLLYIKKNFTMKTYDFIKLNFSNDSNNLVINFLLSKSQEAIQRDELHVSLKNQEIMIKKKKKFTATKSWVFYAESDYDASELCTKLSNWIGTSISEFDDDVELLEDPQNETEATSKHSSDTASSGPTTSPALNTPWKLFKKSNKNQQLQNQTQLQSQTRSPQSSINGLPQLLTSPRQSTGATFYSNSIPDSPSKVSTTSVSASNDVLNFKTMPYDSGLLRVDNNSHSSLTLRSPIKTQNKSSYLAGETSFQPIDDTPRYFKSTLQDSFDLCPNYKLFDVSVPSIVYQCITFLHDQSGEGFEGIFRLNGMMSEVNKIQGIFNEKYDCDLSTLSPLPDVHSIATLLKRYLRTLRDRLISDEITSELNTIINTYGINKKLDNESKMNNPSTIMNSQGIQEFKNTFKQIPELNRNVMFALFKYLCDVLKMGKHNKMTVNAMSVLMGPNLSQCDGGGHICIALLENFDQIFKI